MTLQEKNQKLRKSVLPTLIIWWLKINMKLWQLELTAKWLVFQFYLCKMLKVGNTRKDGVHVFPHTNYQVVIPFRQVCKCLLQLLYPILSKWSDKEMKSRNVLVHDLKKRKICSWIRNRYWATVGSIFFVRKSSCMRNTY